MKNFVFLFLFIAVTASAQENNDSLDLILEKIENLENELARLSNQIDSNTIEVFIGRLRKKMGMDLIKTERGYGYRLSIEKE